MHNTQNAPALGRTIRGIRGTAIAMCGVVVGLIAGLTAALPIAQAEQPEGCSQPAAVIGGGRSVELHWPGYPRHDVRFDEAGADHTTNAWGTWRRATWSEHKDGWQGHSYGDPHRLVLP